MNDREFVACVREDILEANLQIYTQLFENTEPISASDPHWREALQLYASLDEAGRKIFLKVMRQVMVDTISNLFGVFDGVTKLERQSGRFSLELAGSRLEDALQDQFLEIVR